MIDDPYRDPELVVPYDVDDPAGEDHAYDAHNVFPDGEDRVYTSTVFFRTAQQFQGGLAFTGLAGITLTGDWRGTPVGDGSRMFVFRARRV